MDCRVKPGNDADRKSPSPYPPKCARIAAWVSSPP